MLSILICSLKSRQRQLSELLSAIDRQKSSMVEVVVEIDEGQMPVGRKRNLLMSKAKKEYVAFVDDDDMISMDYCPAILSTIECWKRKHGCLPDCVGIVGVVKQHKKVDWIFRHSITVSRWCKDKEKKIYFRTPNHLNPIRRVIASRVKFPETNWGEDHAFSDAVKPLLRTEAFLERPIYFYKVGNH